MDRGKQERIHLGINERRRPAMFNDGDRIGEQVDGVSGQMAACDPYCSDFADNVSPVCLNAGLIQGRGGLSAGQKHSAGNVQARIHRRRTNPSGGADSAAEKRQPPPPPVQGCEPLLPAFLSIRETG
jgi:hypothetical protein